MQMMQGNGATKDNEAFEEAGKWTTEATMNVQTVASLGRENTFIEKYKTQVRSHNLNHGVRGEPYP